MRVLLSIFRGKRNRDEIEFCSPVTCDTAADSADRECKTSQLRLDEQNKLIIKMNGRNNKEKRYKETATEDSTVPLKVDTKHCVDPFSNVMRQKLSQKMRGMAIFYMLSDLKVRKKHEMIFQQGIVKGMQMVLDSDIIQIQRVLGKGVVGKVLAGYAVCAGTRRPVVVKVQISHFDLALREVWAHHRLRTMAKQSTMSQLSCLPNGRDFSGPERLIVYRFKGDEGEGDTFSSFLTSPWLRKSLSLNDLIGSHGRLYVGNEDFVLDIFDKLLRQMMLCTAGGLIHADIKADNILIACDHSDGAKVQNIQPLIIDWGRSIDVNVDALVNAEGFTGIGTIEKLQPLTARRGEPWGYDIDTFALANLLALMLKGRMLEVKSNRKEIQILNLSGRIFRMKSFWLDTIKKLAHHEHRSYHSKMDGSPECTINLGTWRVEQQRVLNLYESILSTIAELRPSSQYNATVHLSNLLMRRG